MAKKKRRVIHNWKELAEMEPKESATHILKVDLEYCNGRLIAKHPREYSRKLSYMRQAPYIDHYLSTHTFYGHQHEWSSKIFHACGFDIDIDNWDKDEE